MQHREKAWCEADQDDRPAVVVDYRPLIFLNRLWCVVQTLQASGVRPRLPPSPTYTVRLSDLEATSGRSGSAPRALPHCRIRSLRRRYLTACRICTHMRTHTHAYAQTTPEHQFEKREKKNLTKPAHICERTSAGSEPYLGAHATPPSRHVVLHRGSKSDMHVEGIAQHGRQLYLMS